MAEWFGKMDGDAVKEKRDLESRRWERACVRYASQGFLKRLFTSPKHYLN